MEKSKKQKKAPQTKEELKDKYLRKTYGITLEEFKEKAKNGCEVCGNKTFTLSVDHVHILGFKKMSPEEKKKYVRGTCCFLCNTSFKSFEKTKDGKRNRQMLEGTVKYFQKWPLKGEIE